VTLDHPPTVELRLGDWREVLPGTYDPARAVVITDPPFGLGDAAAKGYPDTVPWATHVQEVLELLPARRHVIRGPATAVIARDYPQPRRMCVEMAGYRRRAMYRPGVVPHMWMGWAVYGALARVGGRTIGNVGDARAIRPFVDDGMRAGAGHGGITPYGAALWMVEAWAEPGMLVLDPFAGTATIGRAAQVYGLPYLGAEREPAWYAEGVASLVNHQPMLAL
jgi:hypothetical protein